MLRSTCASLLALAFSTAALASTVSFSSHTANCSSGLCSLTNIQHADLNSDGREDLITLDGPNYGHFSVTLNRGDGSYSAPVTYALPTSGGKTDEAGPLVVGDFSHHGDNDIAVFGFDSGNLFVYTNNGKGGFTLTKTIEYSASGGTYGHISAVEGDFNRDNNPDIAFTIDTQLHLFLGDGKGGFTAGLSESVQGNTLESGDFDGDGNADLLVWNDPASPTSAYPYFGDGTGHFPFWNTINVPTGYPVFSVGDVNSDGKSDILVSNSSQTPKAVTVFYGAANRELYNDHTTIPVGGCLSQQPATVADLDGNGFNDLIVTETACSNAAPVYVEVITRKPNATYNPARRIYTAPDAASGVNQVPRLPLVLNADHNTKPDLLFQQCLGQYCANGVSTITLLNTTSGGFPTCNVPTAAEGINVCSPATTAPGSPVTFSIGAALPTMARDVNVWVDGKKVAEQLDGFSNYTFLHKSVSIAAGTHQVAVYGVGWDESTVRKNFTLKVQ